MPALATAPLAALAAGRGPAHPVGPSSDRSPGRPFECSSLVAEETLCRRNGHHRRAGGRRAPGRYTIVNI